MWRANEGNRKNERLAQEMEKAMNVAQRTHSNSRILRPAPAVWQREEEEEEDERRRRI